MKVKKKKEVHAKVKKSLSLALQGGGAHGAFTWGVLDRLIEEENIQIDAISATSAGAMNAAVFVYGNAKGGKELAKKLMEDFWKKVSIAASLSPMQSTFFDKMMGMNAVGASPFAQAADMMRHFFSPYQLNFFDVNPLKDILNEVIDFNELHKINNIKLFVNATNLKTGKIKVFKCDEIDNKVLLASACLPYIAQTVVIDGEKYWDGGFSGNPALSPLIYDSKTSDIVIVQVTPFYLEETPTSIPDIIDRANEISFNTALIKEMKGIEIMNDLITKNKLKDDKHYRVIRVHMVGNEEIMATFGRTSKMNAEWDFLLYLKEVGRQAAEDWLEKQYESVGVKSTYSIVYNN
jgi:NTE family protein